MSITEILLILIQSEWISDQVMKKKYWLKLINLSMHTKHLKIGHEIIFSTNY